jgi:hypothetical protein
MYLRELNGATIDVGSMDVGTALSLFTQIPPPPPATGPTIDVGMGRLAGGVVTNWLPGWFF